MKLSKELDQESEDVTDISLRLAEMGLLRLGMLRANWMLKGSSYLSTDGDGSAPLQRSCIGSPDSGES